MLELAIIRDGAMLIRGDKIEAVGPSSEIEARMPKDAQIIDAGGRVVTPGFVDAHTHLVFAGNRADEFEMRCSGITYQEIARQGGGIRLHCPPYPGRKRKTISWPSPRSMHRGSCAAARPPSKPNPAMDSASKRR